MAEPPISNGRVGGDNLPFATAQRVSGTEITSEVAEPFGKMECWKL